VDDPVLALLVARLDRLEEKIDRLMAFRSYIAGVGAAFGLFGAWLHSVFRGY
jgi:hypothetical protein